MSFYMPFLPQSVSLCGRVYLALINCCLPSSTLLVKTLALSEKAAMPGVISVEINV
ncbi:hypothetical protein KTT_58160 [Tengunoibacter tsumagoiensis]|uniref:Uncharacterized protein n=1 Tax=Tengunoibacter tsumagoiensis TaxID=2014871 RepID=A0A402A9V6_9CHLR|nr:hypothetical protein KTT_58160 [Tengunoibacter tsumagoiensis]